MTNWIIGQSTAIRGVLGIIVRVAPTNATALIRGETGTGKELVVEAIHHHSPRRGGSLLKMNCAAIVETLLESELFGYEKGAFTGATGRKIGKLELADGGTLFLDEIGDIKADLQAKLLRVLQDGRFERVGGLETIKVTNEDLALYDKYTDRARAVILIAREESRRLNYECVGTEHILLAIIKEGDGLAADAMKKMGIDLKQLQMRIEETLEAKDGVAVRGEILFSPRAKKVLKLAVREAQHFGHNYLGTEHILLGLINEGEGIAAQLLAQSDVTLEKARSQVAELLGGS